MTVRGDPVVILAPSGLAAAVVETGGTGADGIGHTSGVGIGGRRGVGGRPGGGIVRIVAIVIKIIICVNVAGFVEIGVQHLDFLTRRVVRAVLGQIGRSGDPAADLGWIATGAVRTPEVRVIVIYRASNALQGQNDLLAGGVPRPVCVICDGGPRHGCAPDDLSAHTAI